MLTPVSTQFAALVAASHEVVTVADVWYDGQILAGNVQLSDAEVSIADTAGVRTRFTGQIADPHTRLAPGLNYAETIGPWGHEINVRTGVRLPNGNAELLSVGWFRLEEVAVDEVFGAPAARLGHPAEGGAVLDIDALDRWSTLDDARFISAQQPPPGATCLAECRRLAAGLVPMAQWPTLPDPPVPADLVYQDSRTDVMTKLASRAGQRLFMSINGNLEIRPLTTLDTLAQGDPDWVLHGGPDGGLYRIRQKYSRTGRANAVAARGEAADRAPVQGVAYDNDPLSATRWDGPYGHVPAFYASPLLDTPDEAYKAARTRLDGLIAGRDRLVEVTGPPHPGVQPGRTTIQAVTPRLTYTGVCVAMKLPCGPATATYTLRVPENGTTSTAGGVLYE